MNDQDLNRLLKTAAPPPRAAEYWEELPRRVTRQLQRHLPAARPAASWLPRLAWAGGFAVVCVAIGFLLGHRFSQSDVANGNGQLLQSEKLIREVLSMFPHRVRAIVKDHSGLQLVLADEADVPTSTPLWVKICRGKDCTTVVTFSGQELQIAGQKMTVLAEADGGVILTGEHFAWASENPNRGIADLKIQARPLQFAAR